MGIIKPHKINSVECQTQDIPRIKKDGEQMIKLCFRPIGKYKGGFAVAHPQVTASNPLRFFATKNGSIIINPKIVRHTEHQINHKEGCLSFANNEMTNALRWYKCEVEYFVIEGNDFVKKTENLKDMDAYIFQHEIDHFDSVYIYDL